jgi:lipopolysaccharide transport system permease protein
VPGPGIVLAPAVFGLIVLSALGIGSALAALNVAYRDFKHAIPFLVQIWMFATPTVYMQPTSGDSPALKALLLLNPLASLIGAFRSAILGGPIDWAQLAIASTIAVALFAVGCLYFRKVEDTFADII